MRRVIIILFFTIVVSTLSAQSLVVGGGEGGSTSSGFMKFQSQQIERVLKLEGERLKQFQTLYAEYVAATNSPHSRESRGGGREHNVYERHKSLSDEQVEAEILDSFARSKRAIEVKEEYYVRFRKILSVREISTMYEIERRTLERITTEVERRAQMPKR